MLELVEQESVAYKNIFPGKSDRFATFRLQIGIAGGKLFNGQQRRVRAFKGWKEIRQLPSRYISNTPVLV